jgi:hypothetical protein
MNLVTRPTAELQGPALRYAMAEAEGLLEELRWGVSEIEALGLCMWTDNHGCWAPDEDWEITGPLIEKYKVDLSYIDTDWHGKPLGIWQATCRGVDDVAKTPLIAACRAIVAAQLGDTVQIPEELLQ